MNALFGIGIAASIIHGVLFDGTFWKIYGVLLVVYLLFVLVTRDMRDNPKRKTIMAATWSGK
jgi:ABC-type transport system involved in Fe-S cluster assembly fused permease/ATPase subunit